jgi:hypothetical protein
MDCIKCGSGQVRITHVYLAGTEAKTQTGVCTDCKAKFTLVTMFVEESTGHGKGALALSNQIIKGLKTPMVVDTKKGSPTTLQDQDGKLG